MQAGLHLCCAYNKIRFSGDEAHVYFNVYATLFFLSENFNPLYSDGFSHTDTYNKDWIVHYILRGHR